MTLEEVRDELIDVLGAVTRALRYRESRQHVGDPAREDLTRKITKELRAATGSVSEIALALTREVGEWDQRCSARRWRR